MAENKAPSFAWVIGADMGLSAVIGFLAWLFGQEPISSLLLSVSIAILGVAVSLRFEFTAFRQVVEREWRLLAGARKDPQILENLERILSGYVEASTGDPYFVERADTRLREVAQEFSALARGRMYLRKDELELVGMRLAEKSQRTIHATSLVTPNDFWLRGTGREYQQANIVAKNRNVSVSRIFMLDGPQDLTEEMIRMIRTQADAGFDARIVLSSRLRQDMIKDFAIFDERYLISCDLVPGSREIRGGELSVDPDEVKRFVFLHGAIHKDAIPASEYLSSLGESGGKQRQKKR